MLTIEDCIALSELTENEIKAIAEHEHVPEMIALELGNYLLHRDDGQTCIKGIILDDIRQAEERGDKRHATRLKLVLRHFMDTHRDQGARLC
ncbi:hypothetical protein N825_16815 [Skermanella stibiiresistens SB22]|uniref:Uncharacterized protein n=1 Tax=Skermanella stibiiresistens SB22 TaxID=1385369 RepID=W9GVA2_9PROT|nr:hypothetical protein [Skermanella stibiiresistens]EWY37714.1 hypothetical protein N825_16815 [Skermanella stibiiresistens SB22]